MSCSAARRAARRRRRAGRHVDATLHERQVDQVVGALQYMPADIRDPRDVVVADGEQRWVLPADRAAWALGVIGGAGLARDVADVHCRIGPDRVEVVIFTGAVVCVTDMGVRRLSRGGEA